GKFSIWLHWLCWSRKMRPQYLLKELEKGRCHTRSRNTVRNSSSSCAWSSLSRGGRSSSSWKSGLELCKLLKETHEQVALRWAGYLLLLLLLLCSSSSSGG